MSWTNEEQRMRERLQWILNAKAERKRGSLRDQSAMMDIADDSHAHGIAFCIGVITGQTKEEVLAEYTRKKRKTVKRKKAYQPKQKVVIRGDKKKRIVKR